MLVSRRNFLKICLGTGGYLLTRQVPGVNADTHVKEALYYQSAGNGRVACLRCPHGCVIPEGGRGFCRVRENKDGKLYNIVYGQPCAVHIDAIEKKPLFHVLPGSKSFSIATVGCNLRCKFCQNWQISQARPEQVQSVTMLPEDIVKRAQRTGCLSIAYTYTEPTVFFEYTLDTSILAEKQGVKNVMHSNAFINPQPLRRLCEHMHAANVDLKAFREDFYQKICAGNLRTVLESLRIIKNETPVWLEITTLVIPTLNDDYKDMEKMCTWINKNLGPEVPLHLSRFFPHYKLTSLPPTPVSTLERARNIAHDCGLQFVYIGNLPGHSAEHTYCPHCHKPIIKRAGYSILENHLVDGTCGYCQEHIPGIWI